MTFEGIERAVPSTSMGVFALGHTDTLGKFCVDHVGRSDTDVRSRLRDYIGSALLFKYDVFDSQRAAFEKECQLYHDFNPPGNPLHPDRPRGTTWDCPRCRIFPQCG